MILAAALMLAAEPPAAPAAEPEGEIMVVLDRLRSLRVNVTRDEEGRWQCGLDRSTGRSRLDNRVCRAVTDCVRKGGDNTTRIETCISTTRAGLLRELEQTMTRRAAS